MNYEKMGHHCLFFSWMYRPMLYLLLVLFTKVKNTRLLICIHMKNIAYFLILLCAFFNSQDSMIVFHFFWSCLTFLCIKLAFLKTNCYVSKISFLNCNILNWVLFCKYRSFLLWKIFHCHSVYSPNHSVLRFFFSAFYSEHWNFRSPVSFLWFSIYCILQVMHR